MKKFFVIGFLSLNFSLLLLSFIAQANQTSLPNYYASPGGNYTKIQLKDDFGGPQQNYEAGGSVCFCAQTSANTSGVKAGVCDTGETGVGYTYTHAGTIFADSTTGYLQICKADGSVASYPGSCFNRYGASLPAAPNRCPNNYQYNGSNQPVIMGTTSAVSWTCCFTGQGTATAVTASKSGCFSTYSNSNAPGSPPYCNTVDMNAYDMGCDFISSTDMNTPAYKRNCCYNDSPGALPLGQHSTCSCTANPSCTSGYTCGKDTCDINCGTCGPRSACSVGSGPGNCICNPATSCGGYPTCAAPDFCGYCFGPIVSCPTNEICGPGAADACYCPLGPTDPNGACCAPASKDFCGYCSGTQGHLSCNIANEQCNVGSDSCYCPFGALDPNGHCCSSKDACGYCGNTVTSCNIPPMACSGDSCICPGTYGCDGVCNSGKTFDGHGGCCVTKDFCGYCADGVGSSCPTGDVCSGDTCILVVNGGWSNWSAYGGSCPGGCAPYAAYITSNTTMTLTRSCNNPAPAGGGSDCQLSDGTYGLSETKSCPTPTAQGEAIYTPTSAANASYTETWMCGNVACYTLNGSACNWLGCPEATGYDSWTWQQNSNCQCNPGYSLTSPFNGTCAPNPCVSPTPCGSPGSCTALPAGDCACGQPDNWNFLGCGPFSCGSAGTCPAGDHCAENACGGYSCAPDSGCPVACGGAEPCGSPGSCYAKDGCNVCNSSGPASCTTPWGCSGDCCISSWTFEGCGPYSCGSAGTCPTGDHCALSNCGSYDCAPDSGCH